jgi:hypothetical protein
MLTSLATIQYNLKKMTKSDSEWGKHFQQLVEYKSTHGDCKVPLEGPLEYSRHPHLGKWLREQQASYKNGTLMAERRDMLNRIGAVWSVYAIKWELPFQELLEYKKIQGNCNVPRAFSPNKLLAHWVMVQRRGSNTNKLSEERKAKLDSIGFIWARRKVAWDTRFEELVEYKRTYGNCNVREKDELELNKPLGRWVSEQRCLNSKHSLRKDRLAKLDSIGFVWAGTRVGWDTRFEELVGYKRVYGHCDLREKDELNNGLGRWVREQCFLDSKKLLRKDRVAKLDSIGFGWARRHSRHVSWEIRFQQLVEYKQTYGNCEPPKKYEHNMELGRWVKNQRYLEGKNSMPKYHRAKLESIGFRFATGQGKKSDGWDAFFEELRDYLRNHGDCNVPEEYRLNPSLSLWVRKQRHDYSLKCGGDQGAMAAEHEAKLNVLGFSWAKRQSSVGSNDNNNNVLCPDKVTSESLTPMTRQRTSHDIPTEVRSNESGSITSSRFQEEKGWTTLWQS